MGCVHIVIIVVGLEVGGIEFHLVAHLIAHAEAECPGVHNERHVVHVCIGESVASELNTTAHLKFVCDIPLGTGQIFVGVAIKQFLTMLIPVSIFIKKVVVA